MSVAALEAKLMLHHDHVAVVLFEHPFFFEQLLQDLCGCGVFQTYFFLFIKNTQPAEPVHFHRIFGNSGIICKILLQGHIWVVAQEGFQKIAVAHVLRIFEGIGVVGHAELYKNIPGFTISRAAKCPPDHGGNILQPVNGAILQ